MSERAAGNERSGCGHHVWLARMYPGGWYPFWARPFIPELLACLSCATVASLGHPVGWTVRGGAWRALAAALLAPLARAFICGANGTDQGQQLTCVAHPGRFSSLSEALTESLWHGGTAREEGWRVGCWWDRSMVPMGSSVCHRWVHPCYLL